MGWGSETKKGIEDKLNANFQPVFMVYLKVLNLGWKDSSVSKALISQE